MTLISVSQPWHPSVNRLDCRAPGQDTVAQGINKLKIDHDIMGMSLYASQRY